MTKLSGADQSREALVDRAGLRPTDRVLDVGCGTGSLAVMLKRHYPAMQVIGLDPDPKALARARRKAERAAVSLRFDQGFAGALAYSAGSFDHVFSSYMFHHLEDNEREKALREIRRVLKPGGKLHFLDFSAPEAGGDSVLSRLLHHRLRDNSASRIVTLMTQAGFAAVRNVGRRSVLFGLGRVVYYRASAPLRP